MTVIEVRGRDGQLIERVRSAVTPIRVGRAFDNDLVLEDEHVSPHHLEISRGEDGFAVRDLDSLNGLHLPAGTGPDGRLASGGALRIGHTTLRVFDEHHPVRPALPFDLVEERIAGLGRHAVWAGLAVLTALATLIAMFWQTAEEFHASSAVAPIGMEIVSIAGLALVWAFVGRLLRHRAHFLAHFSIWIAFGICGALGGWIARTLAYNSSSETVERTLESLISWLVLGAALWASLTLATPLRGRRRTLAAFAAAFGFVGLQLSQQVRFGHVFQGNPEYYGRIQAPAALWAPARPEAALLERLDPLFERADQEAREAER
jgi:hypothetical protein